MKNPFYDWKSDGTYGSSSRQVFNQQRLINWILFTLIGILFILVFTSCSNKELTHFVVEEKGDYNGKYFLLRKIEPSYTVKFDSIKLVLTRIDSIYTVINEINFHYNDHLFWDQFYFSTEVNDTILLDINSKKFWRKL